MCVDDVAGIIYRALRRGYRGGGRTLHMLLADVRQGGVLQVETYVESAWFQRLKVKYDKLLSSFAFNINVHPYSKRCYPVPRTCAVRPGRYCSPRHRMPFNSRSEK
jgi:hypothetical protein